MTLGSLALSLNIKYLHLLEITEQEVKELSTNFKVVDEMLEVSFFTLDAYARRFATLFSYIRKFPS